MTPQELQWLKIYFDQRLHDLEKYIDREIHSQDEAIKATNEQVDRRINGLSKLREEIAAERGLFMTRQQADISHEAIYTQINLVDEKVSNLLPREVYDEHHETLIERVSTIEKWKENITGRVVGVGVIAVIFTATVTAFITHLAYG